MSPSTSPPQRRFRPLGDRAPARWDYLPVDPEAQERLENGGGFTPLLARVLAARGIGTPEAARDFFEPALARTHDPFLLKDMEKAVERIGRAINAGEPIVVYGDYDVDGVSSTAILKKAFQFLGVSVGTYIPHRLREGYGLRREAIEHLAAEGTKLIITVDNGTTANDEIELAVRLGVDVIVTDHHESSAQPPPAAALVNPKQPGCNYPFKGLCGAGVAFKLAHALLKRRAEKPEAAREELKSLLDLVALGTVADVVPLVGENRCFASHGLRVMRNQGRPGIRSLIEVAGRRLEEIQASQIAFTIAPRLNAAGRTDHAQRALDILMTEEPKEARELAGQLERLNTDRRRIEFDILDQALAAIDESSDAPVIVLAGEGWHPGVIGIVASRVVDRYHRPVIVFGIEGEWAKGSGRSVKGFDLHAALAACAEHLEQFGGHTMAVGLRLRASELPSFRESLDEHARAAIQESLLVRRIVLDTEAVAEELTLENFEALERLEPFGQDNPRPVLGIAGLSLVEEPRVLKGRHLKLRLSTPDGRMLSAIGFSMADRAAELGQGRGNLRLAAVPTINRWGGRTRPELEIKDLIVEP